MKLPLLICLGVAAPVAAQAADSGQTSGRADTLALTNVTLIDGTGAPPRPGMTVLVHGDRIGAVFPVDEAPIPASAEVLDLGGQYLIPGLINTHVHLPMIAWARDSVTAGLERMLHAGVTTVREMAGDTRLSAELQRAALVEGASLPSIHYAVRMAGPTFYEPVRDTDRAWIGYPSGTAPWAQAVTAETDLVRAVAMAAGTGATGLKLYTDLDADVVRRLVAEAHRQGLKAWAHGTLFPAGPLDAVRAGIDGLSHICFLFFGLQPVVAASMADRVPFDPDLVGLEGDQFQQLMREMRARDVVLDATARNASRNPGAHAFGCTPELLNRSLGAAHRAGVRISTGTDYVIADGDPDPTLFTEIEYLVDAGVLSPLEAITAATRNGAHAIGIEDRYGTIEPGKVADLVVLSGDPTEDIGALQSVVAVFKGGRQVSRQAGSGAALRTLDVDGHAVRIHSRGLESRAARSPVVVFEGPIEAWTGVLEALGDTVAFLAYDPPGLGQSEWNDARPTPERMSEWARGVLDVAGAEPPYVLVGHSWSGWNLRAVEGRYPSDVAGMVLVDPTGPNSVFQASFDEVEAGPHGSAEFWRLVEGMRAGAPPAARARQQVIDEYLRRGADPDVPEAPSVPFVVLSAGRFDSTELPGAEELSFDVSDFFRVLRRHGTTAHAELVKGSTAGTLVLADGSPHCIHCLEPELVARAIERVLAPGGGATASSDTVHVASPTGSQANDRASILAALERVRPGGTVQFAGGTYLIGGIIRVPTDEITLVGHPRGTVIRGCEPDAFPEPPAALFACHGFELTGARHTVRDLTFEHTWHGLFVGCCFPADEEALESGGVGPLRSQPGGHLIESNTFRYTPNGLRVIGESAEPTVVRDNRFIDVYHAVQINGGAVHVLDNDIGVRNPERVPSTNYPGDAINILPFSSMLDLLQSPEEDHTSCSGNVIARNRIEGYPDGIRILLPDPQTSCRRNEIRDNTIVAGRARWVDIENGPRITDESDSTIVGVPLRLSNWARAGAAEGEDASDAHIEDNLIEGNRVIGAEGVGIEVLHASGNRIANNTITAVERRDPFPGNTLGGEPERWREANGSGIWLSPGSDENEIVGNTFEDIAAFAVVLEGDGNRVELTDTADAVRDLGTGNRVNGPDTTTSPPAYESRFLDAGGVRLHYLDFGGEGLPIVFVHSEGWDAHTYEDFAPRFNDASRVLAVTRPGYGESEAHPEGFDVAAQAESLIDFLDALGIERAVFAGNSSPTVHLTYLAEHHPDRVAGVIYVAGLLTHWLGDEVRESDPTGARVMAARASALDAMARERLEALMSYRPEFLAGNRPPIEVPALAFVGRSGTIGHERFSEPLALVGSALMADFFAELPSSPFRDYFERLIDDPDFRSESLRGVEDSAAREFLLRLAEDTELQAQVWRYQLETAGPAVLAGHDRFRRAFEQLHLVPLDVSTVSGYEYRESPELVEPHIRRFLTDLEPVGEGPQDTIRHTVIVAGQPAGERLSWAESPDIWRYSARGPPSGFRRTARIVLDPDGLPLQMEISGQKNPMETWEEQFHHRAGRATWSTPVDQGELSLFGPAYYAAIHPAHDLGVLARALLRRPTGVLPLLPAGEARLEPLETRVVEVDGRTRTIRLYAIHGLDLRPRHVWLDEEEATFADEWSVLAGWETAFPALRAAIGDAIADRMRRMARALAPPARERPLVIRGARLFDPETHAVHSGTTIIVEGGRILAVGPDGTVDIPADAEVVHAAGRMVLPGLWDMHAHQDPGRYLEWYVPLHLAAGVTATRDMGSHASTLVSLRQRIDAGEVIGPRILMAGFIEGLGGSRTGIQVESAADVQAAVDRYAGLGFVQLKIYNRLPADLVPVAIERAKHHGMRVSGHIPWEMTGREAVASGFDEIQHMTGLMEGMVLSPDADVADSEIANVLAGLTPESELVQEFIGLLASNNVAVDPTLAFFHSTGTVPPTWITDVLDRLPPQARRRWLDRSAPLWAGERWSEILANQFGIVRALHEAGVPVLPGTDMMPGFGLHKELELYVEAGIPAPEVLTLATLGAAGVMGMNADLGSIEPGKLADLILVDGDPTTDISDIRRVVTVIKDGRVYDPAAIYRALGIEPCCQE